MRLTLACCTPTCICESPPHHPGHLDCAISTVSMDSLACGFASALEGDDEHSAALDDDAPWEDVVRERLGFDPTVCRRCDTGPLLRTPIAPSPSLVRKDLERVMAAKRGPP